MFANTLFRAAATALRPNFQQVRNVRKTFYFRYGYGLKPILNNHELATLQETGEMADWQYKPIRFASLWETNSVLSNEKFEEFVRYVMKSGKKMLAYNLMHNCFYRIKSIQYKKFRKRQEQEAAAKAGGKELVEDPEAEQIELDPMVVLHKALKNAQPMLITRKIRRGGAIYVVPYAMPAKHGEYLALKWLIAAVLDRPKPREKHFDEVMAQELIDASLNRGKVIKRRDDIHKLADANKAYAHYRWG